MEKLDYIRPLSNEDFTRQRGFLLNAQASIKERTKNRPTVSLIIPTLNEAQNLPLVLPYLPLDWIDEVLLIDGRSTDNTIEIAKQLLPSIIVIEEKRKGKGIAMQTGYHAAKSDILIVMDADGSNDPREIPRFIKPLLEGIDFVKGSRFAPGGGSTDITTIRKLGNLGFVVISNLLFNLSYTDLCYGFHAFWRHCLDSINLENVNGFEIDTSLYLQAVRSNLKIVEVPSFEGERFYGESKLQTFPDGYRVLKTIFKEWNASLTKTEHKQSIGFQGGSLTHKSIEYSQVINSSFEIPQIKDDLQKLLYMALLMSNNYKSLIHNILQHQIKTLDAAGASIVLLDENGRFREGHLLSKEYGQIDNNAGWVDVTQQGLAGWIINNRVPVLVQNTREDHRWLKRDWDNCNELCRSAIATPLIVGDNVLGVMTLTRTAENAFTEKELSKIAPLASGIF